MKVSILVLCLTLLYLGSNQEAAQPEQPAGIKPTPVNPVPMDTQAPDTHTVDPVVADKGQGDININEGEQNPDIKNSNAENQPKQRNGGQEPNADQPTKVQSDNQEGNPDIQPSRQNRGKNPNAEEQRRQVQQQRRQMQREYEAKERKARQQAEKLKQKQKQRTEKYKAEQERLKKIRQKQKQIEENRKKQMNPDGSAEPVLEQPEISESQRVRLQQKKALKQIVSKPEKLIIFQQMTFQINKQVEEYLLRPSSDMTMVLSFVIYILKNNAYGYSSDISETQSLNYLILENGSKVIGKNSFYFVNAIELQVKAGSVYTVRFINRGVPKLVTLRYPNFLDYQKADDLVSSEDAENFTRMTKKIIKGLMETLHQIQMSRLLDISNQNYLTYSMTKYSEFHMGELVLMIAVCLTQLYMSKGLLKNGDII